MKSIVLIALQKRSSGILLTLTARHSLVHCFVNYKRPETLQMYVWTDYFISSFHSFSYIMSNVDYSNWKTAGLYSLYFHNFMLFVLVNKKHRISIYTLMVTEQRLMAFQKTLQMYVCYKPSFSLKYISIYSFSRMVSIGARFAPWLLQYACASVQFKRLVSEAVATI